MAAHRRRNVPFRPGPGALLLLLAAAASVSPAGGAEVPSKQPSLAPEIKRQTGTVRPRDADFYPDITPRPGTNPSIMVTLTMVRPCRRLEPTLATPNLGCTRLGVLLSAPRRTRCDMECSSTQTSSTNAGAARPLATQLTPCDCPLHTSAGQQG